MADQETVINGLNHCLHGQECCGDTKCPYFIEHLSDACCLEDCQENLKVDAIALLKEQEAVVRCRDCKHCFAEGFVHEHNICDKHEGIQGQPDDWFCADGERAVQS